jgi:hypothetical protein
LLANPETVPTETLLTSITPPRTTAVDCTWDASDAEATAVRARPAVRKSMVTLSAGVPSAILLIE